MGNPLRIKKLEELPLFNVQAMKRFSKMPVSAKQAEYNKRFDIAKTLNEKHHKLIRYVVMKALKRGCQFLLMHSFFWALVNVALHHYTSLATWLIVTVFIIGWLVIAVRVVFRVVHYFLFNKFVDHVHDYGVEGERDMAAIYEIFMKNGTTNIDAIEKE